MKAWQVAMLGTGTNPGSARMVLPPVLDLVVGVESNLWIEGFAIGADLPSDPAFTFTGPGTVDATHWSCSPLVADVGEHVLVVRAGGGVQKVRLAVRAASMTGLPTIKILVLGASFEDATIPSNWLEYADAKFVAAGGTIVWLGTKQASGASAHIFHEAYSGRGYLWYIGEATPDEFDPPPFVFDGVLDPRRWAVEQIDDEEPDLIFPELGANGYTTARLDHPEDFVDLIRQANVLIDALQVAWPLAWIAPTIAMPCRGEHAQNDDHRQRRHIFAELMLANLKARISRGERIIIPGEIACIDPVNGFPSGNDHFDQSGAVQLANHEYALIRRVVELLEAA